MKGRREGERDEGRVGGGIGRNGPLNHIIITLVHLIGDSIKHGQQ